MNEMFSCACGFKCVEGQLSKTEGACPKCGSRTLSNKAKYAKESVEKTNIHKVLRGEL